MIVCLQPKATSTASHNFIANGSGPGFYAPRQYAVLFQFLLKGASKIAYSARQSEVQASCHNAYRGKTSMDLGFFRAAIKETLENSHSGNRATWALVRVF